MNPPKTKTIAIAGASGLVGRALASRLSASGHRVLRLVRRQANEGEIRWDPSRAELDVGALADVEAIINLAGESIGEGRWTEARKASIVESRVKSTELLANTLATLGPIAGRPRAFLCASATGAYGNTGDRLADETTPYGKGFLADVVRVWEHAADPARKAGVRVCHLRLGVVLAKEGGALAKMLLPFSLGLGGPIGQGTQFMSYVSLEDVVRAFERAIADEAFEPIVNVVAKEPVRQREFARALATLLHRPAVAPLPAFAVRAMFGDMGEALLLDSSRVAPAALLRMGFEYAHPTLEDALKYAVKQT